MVDITELRAFVLVGDRGSFTKAAAVLGLTQPTLSRTIRSLEERWGFELFYRTGRGVVLTETGAEAYRQAQFLLGTLDQFSERILALNTAPTRTVPIGLPLSVVRQIVPNLILELRLNLPNIKLRVNEGFSDDVEKWLTSGEIEVAVLSRFTTDFEQADIIPGASLIHLATWAPSIDLPAEIPFGDLAKYPLVLSPLPNRIRATFEAIAQKKGIDLQIVAEADSVETQRRICEKCDLYLITPGTLGCDRDNLAGEKRALIVEPTIRRHLEVATTHQRPLSRAGRVVAERIDLLLREASRARV